MNATPKRKARAATVRAKPITKTQAIEIGDKLHAQWGIERTLDCLTSQHGKAAAKVWVDAFLAR